MSSIIYNSCQFHCRRTASFTPNFLKSMGICAQQHRVCVGVYSACAFHCAQKRYNSLVPDWKGVLYLFDVAGAAITKFLCIVILMIFLFETNNYFESGGNDNTCCAPHTDYLNYLGLIVDIFISYRMYIYIKSICKLNLLEVLMTTSVFTLYFINLLLVLVSNPSLANPGPIKLKKLNVFYQNVRGFIDPGKGLTNPSPVLNLNKMAEFQAYVYLHEPDIICLTETWLWDEFGDNEILKPENYKMFRLDRSRKTHPIDPKNPKKFKERGGGVLIAVRADLNVESKQVKSACKAEILSVELDFGDNNFLVISNCYRVGTLGEENFSEIQKHIFEIAGKQKYKKNLVVGDFNLSSVDWKDGLGTTSSSPTSTEGKFLGLFDNVGFVQHVDHPTHDGGRTLDLVLSNSSSLVSKVEVLSQHVGVTSDHFAIKLDVNVNSTRLKSKKRKILNFKKADWKAMNADLRRVNWDRLLNNCEPEVAAHRFNSVIHTVCQMHVPTVSVKSDFQPPWFDSDVHKACLEKEKRRARYARTKSPEHYLAFKESRKSFKRLVEKKKLDCVMDDSDPSLIPKKFWSYVKSTSNSHRIPETVSYGSVFRNNPQEQTELFNEFFYNQFSDTSEYDIPLSYEVDDDSSQVDFSPERVLKLLRGINSNKAQGPDNIHGKVLKNCAHGIAYPLAKIFKTAYLTGHIPQEWKVANVVPVFKKGSKASVENYRPISLTCLCMKIFERIVREEIMKRCEHRINRAQHGFLSGKSCTTQMIHFTDSLASTINAAGRSDVIYFDFAKAFDSVNHDVLLHKLKSEYGLDGVLLKFIVNYLEGRKQRVVIGGHQSELRSVNSGVPQGSILGPLLFVLFINDMHKCVSPGTKIALYADDTKIWRKIESPEDHVILQNDINALLRWSILNKMHFHPDKCHVVKVTLKRDKCSNFTYRLGILDLEYVSVEKDLGVRVSSTLSWQKQWDSLLSSARSRLGLTKRTCHFIKNRKQRLILYKAMVRSLFQHCAEVWRPALPTALGKFEAVQKRAVKWIFMEDYHHYSDEVYKHKLRELDLLPIEQRFILGDLILFHKIINNEVRIELPDYLELIDPMELSTEASSDPSEHRRLRTTHKDPLYFVCKINDRVNVFRHSFFYRSHNLWNRLPLSIRLIADATQFENELRKHLANTPDPEPD